MGIHHYNLEAEHCRELAAEFFDRPERAVLLKIAETFEGLAPKLPASGKSKSNIKSSLKA